MAAVHVLSVCNLADARTHLLIHKGQALTDVQDWRAQKCGTKVASHAPDNSVKQRPRVGRQSVLVGLQVVLGTGTWPFAAGPRANASCTFTLSPAVGGSLRHHV
ncbi:hypothetical protein IG631_09875 [Alternaria alternata]|nr:hypothetical protein IG631_09875 [Alternaria alternata]